MDAEYEFPCLDDLAEELYGGFNGRPYWTRGEVVENIPQLHIGWLPGVVPRSRRDTL